MTATVSFSMEVELAWGFHDVSNGYPFFSEGRKMETETLEWLLTRCDELDIPFTFDVVGYLLNEEFESIANSPHDAGWLPVEPGSDIDSHPLFYAPDLVRAIEDAEADHELASHTYTHTILGEATKEVVTWELGKTRSKHECFGLDSPTSLVPPRHSEPPLELISAAGFETVRRATAPRMESNVRKLLSLLRRQPSFGEPEKYEGLNCVLSTQTPSLTSPFLPPGQGKLASPLKIIPKPIRDAVHRRFLRLGLKNAIERQSHVHYWTHLFNLSNEQQRELIGEFLNHIGSLKAKGLIQVIPMCELQGRTDNKTNQRRN